MIKNILIVIFLCNITLFAKLNVIVSILPQKSFVQKIGKELVNIEVMVMPGESPATYEPKPSQMRNLTKSKLYFSIGVSFEKIWLKKFKNQNSKLIVVDSAKGIKKRVLKNFHKHQNHQGIKDPHIWLSPKLVKIQAKNILDALVEADKKNSDIYQKNYQNFIKEIEILDNKIKNIFKSLPKNRNFMVFHPTWGYFADDYGLNQMPIEIEGKEPKPNELKDFIKQAKKNSIKVIFVQKEFSSKMAKVIAKEAGAKVIKVSPLSLDWAKNLELVAKIFVSNLKTNE